MDKIGVFFSRAAVNSLRDLTSGVQNQLSMLISKFFVEKISPPRIFLQIHIRG